MKEKKAKILSLFVIMMRKKKFTVAIDFPNLESARPQVGSLAVVADGLDRAAFHGFLAKGALVVVLRLLVNVGISAVVVAGEVVGSGFAAEVAVDALVIDVEGAGGVFGIAIIDVGHGEFRVLGGWLGAENRGN